MTNPIGDLLGRSQGGYSMSEDHKERIFTALCVNLGPPKPENGKHGQEWKFKCPLCGRNALFVNLERERFQCWHCGDFKGGLAKFERMGIVNLSSLDEATLSQYRDKFSKGVKKKEKKELECWSPGKLIKLSKLPEDHEAIIYLKERGFDPFELESKFKIAYCSEGKWLMKGTLENGKEVKRYTTSNTLIIPVYQDKKLIAWQSRVLFDPKTVSVNYLIDRGYPFDKIRQDVLRPSKYYTMFGFVKEKAVYNIDNAKESEIMVISEGVFDVASIGLSGVMLFGKTASEIQMDKIASCCAPLGNVKLVVVMLDADAGSSADKIEFGLKKRGVNVISAPLSGSKDPGETPRSEIWKHIVEEAGRRNKDVTNKKVLK